MSLLFNISIEEVRGNIGEELWKLTQAYIYEFFAIETSENLEIVLKAIANSDGSFSIYEQDTLLVLIVPDNNKSYYVQPLGICKVLMSRIFQKFDMIENHHEFMNSIYNEIFMSYEQDDLEKPNLFVFYMSSILVYVFNFDIYQSHISMKKNGFSMNCYKEEFISDGNGSVDYQMVSYLIIMNGLSSKIKIIKMYDMDNMADDIYDVDIYDIINNCIKQC